MSDKPIALGDSDLDDIAMRLVKGWRIRLDHMQSLIAMARERNELIRARGLSAEEQQKALTAMYGV